MKLQEQFKEDSIIEYNAKLKKLYGILKISSITLLILTIAIFFLFLKDSNNIIVLFISGIIKSIYTEITSKTLLGATYTALFGGLFFVFLPLEVLFITFLKTNNPIILISVFMIFLSISYLIDYFLGLKFGKVVKNLIGAEKFYETKGIVNKYGKIAIFVFNVLPLPSQQLSAVLGVFKYNKIRFYLFFFLGQLVKYIFISFAVLKFGLF